MKTLNRLFEDALDATDEIFDDRDEFSIALFLFGVSAAMYLLENGMSKSDLRNEMKILGDVDNDLVEVVATDLRVI